MLLVIAAFDALALLTEALQLVVLGRVASGEGVSEALVSGNDFAFATVGVLQVVLFVAGAITFIRWLRRAYGNLPALGQRTLRRGAGWTIGAWFVPILNLFWPYQLVGDTWRGSNPLAPAEGVSDVSRPAVPALVDWWWALWLITQFLSNAAGRYYFRAEEVEELQRGTVLYVVSDATSLVAALLAWQVVRRTTHRQETRAAVVLGFPPPHTAG
ncbi:MAG: DUF4328 domain-containing protein [Thermoleophilaceae bacterium]